MRIRKFSVTDRIKEVIETRSVILDLSRMELHELPASIGQIHLLKHLQRINLNWNFLTELPESIGEFEQVQVLDLEGNRLTDLPQSIANLTRLQTLMLGGNNLSALPESIGQLKNLRILGLHGNMLTELPACIGQLKRLKKLGLKRNRLTSLPASIGKLVQLRILDLSENQIAKLPASIGKLARLQEIDLSHNRLVELPASLGKLGSLTRLALYGNPIIGIPREFIDRPSPAAPTLEYYFRVQTSSRPLNEAKLILVGRGGVGKTSIVNRLLFDRFERDEKKTEGIRITEWKLQFHGKEKVRLNIWDFGGQEIQHATHQFFLTQRSLYLLVLNGREELAEADADYWLRLIESFGHDSPVIVVLNKIKEVPFDVNRRALKAKFQAVTRFIETDCADRTGIQELRAAIEHEAAELKHLRDAFPASWFSIKDRLAGMKENYLTFHKYRSICRKFGEMDTVAQESLASFLHTLGIVLNYKDDARLQDTHVLNPHWVTKGIYTILHSDILRKQKGEIRINEVSGTLEARKYPARMRLFLFDLMKKFDLCFSFPDDETHFLIPELLDIQEPESSAAFKPEECLNFEYHYHVLPEGLLPRFIVRTHRLSEGLPRWRTGVILKFEDNQALVKSDLQDRKVYISVSGPRSGRRRLLAIIRSDFERIHSDIRNLNPEAMIPLPKYPRMCVAYQKLLVMERNGIKDFPEVVDDMPVQIRVEELLNGVDLGSARTKAGTLLEQSLPVRLFYSYSHKDESFREDLETHLKLLHRRELIEPWHDRNIEAGDEWKQVIDQNLEAADIILLLVSANFIASDYCYEKEMKRALEKHDRKEARVVPVIVRDCNWTKCPFGNLKAVPKDGKAITKWRPKDSGWRNVSEEIEKVIVGMSKKL